LIDCENANPCHQRIYLFIDFFFFYLFIIEYTFTFKVKTKVVCFSFSWNIVLIFEPLKFPLYTQEKSETRVFRLKLLQKDMPFLQKE